MKYIEVGIGNTWIVRTETELADGSEVEQKGIIKPIIFYSIYLRLWIGKTVYIWDSKQGFKKMVKPRKAFKVILGLTSYLADNEAKFEG
ncbi:DUF3977 family protein [Paenibacillus sp. CGMCC 1.16610]|uniref:DUF3977 family protein n=1 Tax=Paenibacillus anseongense TaxID=2682845 RepID=A0ABW9UAZ2_9BACL|nr:MULTISPECIES: DUF3977 family protein [Paenibacillus]MBA2937124.1 DUF3977 family protein [Paenibacillus sp. CGMCC 1.16610]MVQ36186.1 DUF3977 family protein [Paenibacillus anseongense]